MNTLLVPEIRNYRCVVLESVVIVSYEVGLPDAADWRAVRVIRITN